MATPQKSPLERFLVSKYGDKIILPMDVNTLIADIELRKHPELKSWKELMKFYNEHVKEEK